MFTTWRQYNLRIPPKRRGFHLITDEIRGALPCLQDCNVGMLNVFIKHTSASISLNENADPDVRLDFETHFNRMCPDGAPWLIHICEGPDDMSAHLKASMLGFSIMLPVKSGRLCLGTWQGIYLGEHRDHATAREFVLTIQGDFG